MTPKRGLMAVCLVLALVSCSRGQGEGPVGLIDGLLASDRANLEGMVERAGAYPFLAPRFESGEPDPVAAAFEYLVTFAPQYGVDDPRSRLTVRNVTPSAAGTIVRFDQDLGGLSVLAGDLTVTVRDGGRVDRVIGVLVADSEVADAVLSGEQAVAAALGEVGPDAVVGPEPLRLVVYAPVAIGDEGAPVPAWEVVASLVENGVPVDEQVVVNAIDGSILFRAPLTYTEESWDVYDANNQVDDEGKSILDGSELVIETRGSTSTVKVSGVVDAEAANQHLRAAWEYFNDVHGRDAYNGDGGKCDVYVHVGQDWRNASFGGNQTRCRIRFGGAGYAREIDVVAHEYAHGVVTTTAGLIYKAQSGALNEHYADFFAAMVDTEDWLIGGNGELLTESGDPDVLRDMARARPSTFDQYVTVEEDHGGVHTYSSFANLVSFLVGNPGTNRHWWTGDEVQGIGREKTEQVWYATLLGLTPWTDYRTWTCATIFTARDMVGSLLSEEEAESVVAAMTAVGLYQTHEVLGRTTCDPLSSSGDPDDGGDGESDPSGDDPPGDDAGEDEPGDGDGDDDDDEEGEDDPNDPDDPDDGEDDPEMSCPVAGLWRLRDQAYLDEMARISGAGFSFLTYYSGEYTVELRADGVMVATRRNWVLSMSPGGGGPFMMMNSVDRGSWGASAEELTITVDQPGEVEIKTGIFIGGVFQELPMPPGMEPMDSSPYAGTGTYSCVDDVLTVSFRASGVTFTSIHDRQ